MKLQEAIKEIMDSNMFNLELRRESWTHGDSLQIIDQASYMGGSLFWKHSGNRAELHFIEDLIANDWTVE